jgi:hypothetical protein
MSNSNAREFAREIQREVARERRRQESNDMVKGLVTLAVIGFGGYYWFASGNTTPKPSDPALPYAQSAFVASLDGYRNQYSDARDNKNDVQQNRVFDARKKELLCQTDPNIEDWIVKVDRVNTNWVNDRHEVWVVLQVSKHVWFNSEIVDATKNSALFETIASLKQGDKVRVSGTFRRDGDLISFGDYLREEKVKAEGSGACVRETSATQWGGMTTPEFGITISSIGNYRATAVKAVPLAAPAPVVVEPSSPTAAKSPTVEPAPAVSLQKSRSAHAQSNSSEAKRQKDAEEAFQRWKKLNIRELTAPGR